MKIEQDKTNFAQSLMHTIKGNLGTGILAMSVSFAHTGFVYAIIGLPLLCLIATYCVHLLVRSSQHLEGKMKWMELEYAELAKGSFKSGPKWMKPWAGLMCTFVDFILIVNQMGICCVYLVFIVDNLISILSTYQISLGSHLVYLAILPFVLLLSYIRTLKRLSIASSIANAFQVVGIAIILEHLIRTLDTENVHIDYVRPIPEVALGFGAAMFAFEGISVILPIYTRMKRPEQMGGCFGIINLSYTILLILYFTMGTFGYLKYGSNSKASITLNLPKEILYDCVRGIFIGALILTYPLQFYVPYEIIWNSIKPRIFVSDKSQQKEQLKYEYFFRTLLVLVTFVFAYYIPKLNLMMDLVGSISGTALSITLPALIHMAAFWEDTSGASKAFMVIVDVTLMVIGTIASASGSYFSFIAILKSFSDPSSTDISDHLLVTTAVPT